MSVNNPMQAYEQNRINTASPGELTLMLYNGCLKFLKQAKAAIEEKNMEEKNTNLIKAQNIIQELSVTLDMNVDISAHMLQMYDFVFNKLVEANINNDVQALTEAEEFITNFRDTWKEALQVYRKQTYGQQITQKSVEQSQKSIQSQAQAHTDAQQMGKSEQEAAKPAPNLNNPYARAKANNPFLQAANYQK